jgi:hypothetical protein
MPNNKHAPVVHNQLTASGTWGRITWERLAEGDRMLRIWERLVEGIECIWKILVEGDSMFLYLGKTSTTRLVM